MTVKRETTFYQGVNRHLPEGVYRMKTFNPLMGGPPDFYYEGPRRSLWVEYKFLELPKRDTTLVDNLLSDLQDEWLHRAFCNNQKVLVVAGISIGRGAQGFMFTTPDEWRNAWPVAQLKQQLITQQGIANYIQATCS